MNQIIKTKLTKSFLNKTIKWSTSRYNVWNKSGVVDIIYNGMQDINKAITKEIEFKSGSYCECSNMTATGTYQVNFTDKTLTDIENNVTYQF